MHVLPIAHPTWQTTLPYLVAPREEEWLAGLLLRCDETNGWTKGATLKDLRHAANTHAHPPLDELLGLVLLTSTVPLATLARWLAIPVSALIATTYQSELARLYDMPHPHRHLLQFSSFGICPLCLQERLLRREAVLPFIWTCSVHHIFMKDSCPCGALQKLFSEGGKPFACHNCGLDWKDFPPLRADEEDLKHDQKYRAWYELFFSKGSRLMLARAIQLIQQTMEERNVYILPGHHSPVTFSSPEKTSLNRLLYLLDVLELSPADLEADDSPLLWRPINWQAFYCPVSICPYMSPVDGGKSAQGTRRSSSLEK